MSKLTIFQKAFSVFAKTKEKIDRRRFSELGEIFDDKDKAIDYITCIPFNMQYNINFKEYAKIAGYLEGSYQDILYKLYELINEIKPNPNLQDILYIFCYIVRNGYLSKDKKFIFNYPIHELDIRKGLSVCTGIGVCRNLSALLSDLLIYFGYNSFPVMTDRLTYESDEMLLIKEFADIKDKNDDKENDFMECFNEKQNELNNKFSLGNHVEVIAIKDKKWYMLDPTAICMYAITSKENEYPITNFYRPWALYATATLNLKDTCRLHKTLKTKYLKLYKSNKVINIQKDCFNSCEKNKEKILKFNERIQSDIDFINLNLNEI